MSFSAEPTTEGIVTLGLGFVGVTQWWLLLQGGAPVGFYRQVGRADMYSRDGYAWSGRPIEWEERWPETGIRDQRSSRIFHGDVVKMRLSSSDASTAEQVVLTDESGQVWLGSAGSMRIRRLEESFPPPARARAQARLGSILRDDHYRLLFDGSIGALERRGVSPWPLAVTAAVGLFAGLWLTGALQLEWMGRVEPLSTVLGAVLVLALALVGLRRRLPDALRRQRLLVGASRAGWLLGPALGVTYGLAAMQHLPGLPHEPAGIVMGAVAAGILGFLLALALTSIVGNSVDHYWPKDADTVPKRES